MSVGAKVTSNPAARQFLWTSSTSSTHTDIHAPLSPASSPSTVKVVVFAPLPRPPCAPAQRKISHSPEPTAPNVGGVPQSQHFLQPHFSNHAKLAAMSDTFNIGVTCFAFISPQHIGGDPRNQGRPDLARRQTLRRWLRSRQRARSPGSRGRLLRRHRRLRSLHPPYPRLRHHSAQSLGTGRPEASRQEWLPSNSVL